MTFNKPPNPSALVDSVEKILLDASDSELLADAGTSALSMEAEIRSIVERALEITDSATQSEGGLRPTTGFADDLNQASAAHGKLQPDTEKGLTMPQFTEEQIQETVRNLMARSRELSIEERIRSMKTMGVPIGLLNLARERISEAAEAVRLLRDPAVLEANDAEAWYAGPSSDDVFWPSVSNYLLTQLGSKESWASLDRASTRVVSCLANPHRSEFSLRGLVAGDVQSGKTSNFTAVIAKAADAGYGLVLVLSGTKSKLRRQTQSRLEQDLVEREPESWFLLTSKDRDFGAGVVTPAGQVLVRWRQQPALAVVKKNARVLAHLKKWIEGAPATLRASIPVLIIDDEADEASINARKPEEQRTAVNSAILEILRLLKKASFVGYTATPYANFLIDATAEEDLYPRDFILNLSSGKQYFGYERIFGRERTRYEESDREIDGLDMVRTIDPKESEQLRASRGKEPQIPNLAQLPALTRALAWFVLCTAARAARGQGDKHSSMLIHTSQRVAVHRLFKAPVEAWLAQLQTSLERSTTGVLDEFRLLWNDENARVPATEWNRPNQSFESILKYLLPTLKKTRVIVENGMTPQEERLVYGDEGGSYVVIGGDVLSRGLTLEGLVCSYFTRSASTYDTLMQMGRWFGYRRGFEELPRIWMTGELKSAFYELGGIDREMRQQIDRTYRPGLTPRDFAPMIRRMPSLAVTSRMKMQGKHVSEVRIDYGRRRVQTILFHHRDSDWLLANQAAAKELIASAIEGGRTPEHVKAPDAWLMRGVDCPDIIRFLSAYRFHEQSWNLNSRMIREYIQKEVAKSSLQRWNVLVLGGKKGRTETIDLGLGAMHTIVRSRIDTPGLTYANIKSLMSLQDTTADLTSNKVDDFDGAIQLRAEQLPRTGLLILYPIDRRSDPRVDGDGEGTRAPLDAAEVVIGAALVFPPSVQNADGGSTYVTQVFHGSKESEEAEVPDEEQLEAD